MAAGSRSSVGTRFCGRPDTLTSLMHLFFILHVSHGFEPCAPASPMRGKRPVPLFSEVCAQPSAACWPLPALGSWRRFSWEGQRCSCHRDSPTGSCVWGEVFAAAALGERKPSLSLSPPPPPPPRLVLVDSCPGEGAAPEPFPQGGCQRAPTWLHGVPDAPDTPVLTPVREEGSRAPEGP